jgi:ABC-type transport system involved in cytochrome c biogenesis permease component
MRFSRRALFFLAVAVVFLLMIPPTPLEFRWLNLAMAGLALFWAALLGIEDLLNGRRTIREGTRADADDLESRTPGG